MRASVALLLLLTVAACGGKTEDDGTAPAGPAIDQALLLGRWKGPSPHGKATLTYDIQENGKVTLTTQLGMPLVSNGSWKTRGSQIKLMVQGQWDQGWLDVTVEGDELVLDGKHRFARQP